MKTPKFKKVNKIKLLKTVNYRGCMIYIRQIGIEIFEWLVVFNEQVFSSYIVMKPETGKKRLTKVQQAQTAGIVFTGAITTIDTLLENKGKSVQNNIKPNEIKIKKRETKTLH